MTYNNEHVVDVGPIETRKAVKIFTEKMERRLREKDGEHGPDGWLDVSCSVRFLHDRLTEKLTEARCAMNNCSAAELEKRCTDIANFSMMISDRLRGRCSQGD